MASANALVKITVLVLADLVKYFFYLTLAGIILRCFVLNGFQLISSSNIRKIKKMLIS